MDQPYEFIQQKAAAVALAGTNRQAIDAVLDGMTLSDKASVWNAMSQYFGGAVDAVAIEQDHNMPFPYQCAAIRWSVANGIREIRTSSRQEPPFPEITQK